MDSPVTYTKTGQNVCCFERVASPVSREGELEPSTLDSRLPHGIDPVEVDPTVEAGLCFLFDDRSEPLGASVTWDKRECTQRLDAAHVTVGWTDLRRVAGIDGAVPAPFLLMGLFEESDGRLDRRVVSMTQKESGTENNRRDAPHPCGGVFLSPRTVNRSVGYSPGRQLIVLVKVIESPASVLAWCRSKLSKEEQRED